MKSDQQVREYTIGFAKYLDKYPDRNRNHEGDTLYARSKYDESYLIEELIAMYESKDIEVFYEIMDKEVHQNRSNLNK